MRIAVVRLSATPLVCEANRATFGGAEVRAATFALGLTEMTEHEVTFVVQATATQPGKGVSQVNGRRLQTAAVAEPPAARRRFSRLRRSILGRLGSAPPVDHRLSEVAADVYLCFGVHWPTPGQVRWARQSGKAIVVALTSDADAQHALHVPATGWTKHQRSLRHHQYALLNADAVLVQTNLQRRLVESAGQACFQVRNPIDTRRATTERLPLVERRSVLWVGRADDDCKRADLCIAVARRCPEVPFVMVMNPGKQSTTRRLHAVAPPNVQMIDSIPWGDSDQLYQHALALLNTSDSEGFPNAFLEAANFGVPILSRRVDPDGVLTRHGIGFIARDDLDKLAEMVCCIHRYPTRFQHVSDCGPHYVQRYHSLDDRVHELELGLRRIADRPGPARYAA